MSGPPGFPFPGFRPGMPGGMGYPGAPPAFGGMPGGMGMRPMMMPPGGMGGMGMGGMPLGMGMSGMRPPMPGPGVIPLRPAMGSSALAKSVYVPPSIAEKSTTVYVGKIASSVPDSVVRTLLDACGRVKSWKRQVDPDTKQPKGFGFCEFEDAEGVLRAMRLLNGLKLDGQELLLKCNAATTKYTEQYEQQKNAEKAQKKAKAAAAKATGDEGDAAAAKEGGGDKEQGEADEDEDAAADNRVLEVIMSVVSEREEQSRGSLPPPPPLPAGVVPGAAQAASDFLAQLGSPVSGGKPAAAQPDREKDGKDKDSKDRERELREREREWAREADAERRKEEDRRRELDAKYEMKLREWERYERERATLRERERDRRAQAEADWRRTVRADLDAYESDDDRESWERRPLYGSRKSMERRKRRLAEEEEDEIDRQREVRDMERRAKRAAAAAAEVSAQEGTPGPAGSVVYDAHPPVTSPVGPSHADAMEAAAVAGHVKAEPKVEAKTEPEVDTNDPIYQAMLAAARAPPPVAAPAAAASQPHHVAPASGAHAVKQEDAAMQHHRPHGQGHDNGHGQGPYAPRMMSESPPHGGAVSGSTVGGTAPGVSGGGGAAGSGRVIFGAGGRARTNAALAAMFGDEEETTKKRQLKPIRYSEEEMLAVSDAQPETGAAHPAALAGSAAAAAVRPPTDPKAALKSMMDSIPTSRDGVFSYEIKWDHYNAAVMGEKFKGWVSSKVFQLLGVQEPTLVDYVVKLLGQNTAPDVLLGELNPVLDNDTETFVIKLYRMVIYETEKAALGLGHPA